MRKLWEDSETFWTIIYFNEAKREAEKSSCYISRCGAVLVKDKEVIGRGFNFPPGNRKLEKCFKDSLPENFKSDRNCCVHAGKRAIDDALNKHGKEKVKGSTLYFTRINNDFSITPVGKPYCTICSKEAVDNGIEKWVLFHEGGFYEYYADEYNNISFEFENQKPQNL